MHKNKFIRKQSGKLIQFIFTLIKQFLLKSTKRPSAYADGLFQMVEVTGFEPAASSSRTKRSTKLSHTSKSLSLFAQP